tara:strand:+ start:252 stop:587 length:336 start_codon:yes stop_codon:yes gene_type:complete
MNEQVHPIFGGLAAVVGIITFLYYFYLALDNNDDSCNLDNFTIGYVVDENPQPVAVTVNIHDDFFRDCKDALVAVGCKKSKAKALTKKIFSNKIPKDIQSFLKEALANENK